MSVWSIDAYSHSPVSWPRKKKFYFGLEIASIQLMFDGTVRSVLGVACAVVWSRTLSSGRDVIQRWREWVASKVCRRTTRNTHTRSFTLPSLEAKSGEVRVGEEGGREVNHIISSKREKCLNNKSWKPQDSCSGIFFPGYWIGVFLTEVGYILLCLPFPRRFFPQEAGQQNSKGRVGRVGLWSRRKRRGIVRYQTQYPVEWESTD